MSKVVISRVKQVPPYAELRDYVELTYVDTYKYYVYGHSKALANLLFYSREESKAMNFADKLVRTMNAELEVEWAKLFVVEVPVRASSVADAIDKVIGDDMEMKSLARARVSS